MTLDLVKDRLWKGGACTKPVPDKQLGQAQPVPVGQVDWHRLCLSQWDKHNLSQWDEHIGTGCVCPSGTSRLAVPNLTHWD